MNRACTACGQQTIGKKWLVYATFLPLVFLFIQIRCGRCQQEQVYEFKLHWLLMLAWELLFPLIIVVTSVYLAVWFNFNIWLLIFAGLLLYGSVCGIKLHFLNKQYP